MTRLLPGATAVAALLAASCGGAVLDDAAGQDAATARPPVAGPHRTCIPGAEFDDGDVANEPVRAADFPWDRVDPVVLDGFDFTQVISGGPPPDGIRPIDEPCFDTVAAADDWLEPQSPVMVVEVGDDIRAYPLAILTQHEIVNDVVGGMPVVVTYCPLCNSGLAFERTVDGQVLDFGTSGRLFQSNLVMYERQTRTLWAQFTGQAVVGVDFVGTELVRVPTALVGWDQFVGAAPDGVVLSRESMPGRDYGRNPYPGYQERGDQFLFRGPRDDSLPPNTRVVGIGAGVDPVAIPLDRVRDEGVVDVDVDGRPLTVWWMPGQASALDTARIDEGEDIGSTAVFVRTLADGTVLDFDPADDGTGVIDRQTGSTWNLLGEAVAGELADTRLEVVSRDDTFWFVWFAFQPDTAIAHE